MSKKQNSKHYDLEERTFAFARDCRNFLKKIVKNSQNSIDGNQLLRSSGSVAANYIEANESVSRKDFIHRIKICRKEAKESRLWFRLLDLSSDGLMDERDKLIGECVELGKIFGAILEKSK